MAFVKAPMGAKGRSPDLRSVCPSLVFTSHGDETTVPTVLPDIAVAAVDGEHPVELAVLQKVQRIVAIEGIRFAGRPPR
mgnify:CR=1 FL=1